MSTETEFLKAAKAGNASKLKDLFTSDNDIKNTDDKKRTPLMLAAMAGNKDAVDFLLDKGADITARDENSYTIFTLTLNAGHKEVAQHIVKRGREKNPKLKVTDPRLTEGAVWLKEQFDTTTTGIPDKDSKPKPELLNDLLKYPDLRPVEGRDVSDVYWEHIFLRFIGDVPMDIKRNYAEDLDLSLVGTYHKFLTGHEGIKESARLLNVKLKSTEYDIVGTYVKLNSDWVTERWGYHDGEVQVVDGIDTFLIYDGKIKVKMINYTVERAWSREEYRKHMKLSWPEKEESSK